MGKRQGVPISFRILAGMSGGVAGGVLRAHKRLLPPLRFPGITGACAAAINRTSTGIYSLYRVKQDSKFCHVNLLGGMGYPTLNHYTSLTDARYLAVMKKLGYSSYWMETSGCCGTLVSDILMSNKYVIDGSLNWTPTGSGGLG